MKKLVVCFSFLILLLNSCTNDREINTKTEPVILDPNSELIYYWNFNLAQETVTEVTPNYSASNASSAKITYPGTGDGYMDIDTDGYVTNVRNNDPAETLLKVRNPSNTRSLNLDIPTTGFRKIVLQFATARSNNGANTQNYTYTIDGSNYINTGLIKIAHNPNTDPTPPIPDVDLVTLDFSNIDAVNNNANFKVKIEFAGDAASGLTGNNRFDNVTLEGVPLNEPPSGLTYSASNTFAVDTAITPIVPSVNGAVTSYSVSPELPTGLNLDTTTGIIAGIPTIASAAANYTITATNAFGNTTAVISIEVTTAVVDTTLYLFQYWNFNNLDAPVSGVFITTPVLPDATLIASNTANITYPGVGGNLDSVDPGNEINAQNGDAVGFGLRARNPSNTKELLIKAPSTGYKNIIMKFATAKSSAAGASIQNYSYSIDGTTFVTTGLAVTTFSPNIEPIYDEVILNFSGITGANNNPNFTIKISFGGPETINTNGNNRFDNITLQGNIL